MPVTVSPVRPADLPPVFAALYGAPGEAVAWMADVLVRAWMVQNKAGEVVGAVGLRPSPAHGAELVGGALPGPDHLEAATALAYAARQDAGCAYAFADGSLFPAEALEAAGYREVGAYRLLAGPTPAGRTEVPEGLRLLPLADVSDPATRLDALATYEDRIGHHAVTPEAAADGAGGFDPHLSLIALDAEGRAAGLCRAAPEELYARIDAPGVRADLRHTGLRAALLLGVCALARARGLEHVSVESWGDTPGELAQDLALGLGVETENPILAVG
ncbi:hypothetical protein DEIPH_ctg004orf0202 [Deinococcus phoenicis]|uniref:N-acetyltransferase domain-containing protein n=1 Tax=Deinococcus phoenicis TaxID=1476583 RepID=A0A016QUW9_9DEIO|nr:hypothetical protein [Deinococcus phoenicis]EYB69667.1 hypothetical protein DEIPH_ctg004orf0202 [Deinococcus phoenicis]